MEYDNIESDKVREDYFREMNLLSGIMENINKNNQMESKLAELFSEISNYNRGKEVLKVLQNKSSINGISKGDENISNDELLYIPSELADIDNMMRCNEINIRKAINLIRKARYNEGWKSSYLYEEDFLQIAGIPVYLPGIFPDVLSAEFLLYILYGDKMVFVPKESDMPDEEKDIVYKNRYRRVRYNPEPIEKELNVKFANTHRGEYNNSDLWDLVNMYSYIDIFIRLDAHRKQKTFKGTFGIHKILNLPKEDLFHVLQIEQMDDNLKKLVLFKTIIFQRLYDDERIKIYCHELLFKIRSWMLKNYIENILWFPLLTIKYMAETSERYKDNYNLMWKHIHGVQRRYEEGILKTQEPYIIEDNNFWINIFGMILKKRHAAYYKTKTKLGIMATPWIKLDDNQRIVFQSLITQDKIGVSTRQKFYNKYKEKIDILFPNRIEFDKSWDIGIKALLYLYPTRFQFPTNSKYVKKNLRDWFKLTKGKINESDNDSFEKKKEQSAIKAVMYKMKGIRQDEIFPLMLMVAGAIRGILQSEICNDSDDMWRIQFYRDLDNIGKRYSPSLIESLRIIYEAHLQAGIMREQEVRWRFEMWQYFMDGIQNADDMESEANQINRLCCLLNDTFVIVMEILNSMQRY